MTGRGRPVAPPPGDHGGDGPALARRLGVAPEAVLDLSVTVNPLAPDPAPVVAGAARAVHRYPDDQLEATATAALADRLGVDPARVLLTAGAAEAIAVVAARWPVGDVVEPEFSLYRRHLREVRAGAPRWRSDPRNPTGRLAAPGERAAVWDEAFRPLSTGRWWSGRDDAVVIGSLTKLLGCPGLPVGYVVAPDPVTRDALWELRPRWSPGTLALTALPALLDRVDLPGWAATLVSLREDLVAVLAASGWTARVADAPWVLVPDAAPLRERLAGAGIAVRDCASFGMPGTVRIAVPDGTGLLRLAATLGVP